MDVVEGGEDELPLMRGTANDRTLDAYLGTPPGARI